MRIDRNLLLGLPITVLFASTSFADCPACSMSHGIRIQLKSGTTQEGYFLWNHFRFEEIIQSYDLARNSAADDLLKDWGELQGREAFDRWVKLVNFALQNNLPLQSSREPIFALYKNLVQIKYPIQGYAAVQSSVVEIPISKIAGLSVSTKHRLFVDTSGIPVLAHSEILLLAQKSPRFYVEVIGPSGVPHYFIVYAKGIRLTDILEHVMTVFGDQHEGISVNGVRIAGSGGYAPDNSGKPLSDLGPLRTECDAFLRKLQAWDRPHWKALTVDKNRRIPGVVDFSYGAD